MKVAIKTDSQAAIIEHPSAKKHPQFCVFNTSLAIVLNRAKEYTPNDDVRVLTAMDIVSEYLRTHKNEVEADDVANKETVDQNNSQDE